MLFNQRDYEAPRHQPRYCANGNSNLKKGFELPLIIIDNEAIGKSYDKENKYRKSSSKNKNQKFHKDVRFVTFHAKRFGSHTAGY